MARILNKDRNTSKSVNENRVVCAGIIGIEVVILQAFIPIGFTAATSVIIILAFAISVPLLSSYIFGTVSFSGKIMETAKQMDIALVGGFGTSLIGIVAAFWYISWIASVVLIFSGILAFIIYGTTSDLEEEVAK